MIVLSEHDRDHLAALARAGSTPQRLAGRARVILLAAAGWANAAIATRLRLCVDTVRKWRHRWAAAPEVASLADAERTGRPPRFTPVQITQLKALACQPPEEHGLALSRWSCPSLASQAVTEGICESISASTVRRALDQDAIKPWQHRSWIFPRDPDFAVKAARVLDLYARTWDGGAAGRRRVRDQRR